MPPERALRIGIGGPVGSGKSSLVAALCRALGDELEIGVVTNDIYTSEDALFLRRTGVLPPERILAVETGGCPHTAIRDDVSANLEAVAELEREARLDLVLVESGGDNLTAIFSPALADVQIFVIDVAGGDDIPRKGGPGITRSDLLVDQQGGPRRARRLRSRPHAHRRARQARRAARAVPLAPPRPAGGAGRRLGPRPASSSSGPTSFRPRSRCMTTTTITTSTRTSQAGRLRLRVERRGGRSALVRAEGHVPYAARLVPRRRRCGPRRARADVAGPLAGDRTEIEIEVGAGAALELRAQRCDPRVPGRVAGPATRCEPGSGRAPASPGSRSR